MRFLLLNTDYPAFLDRLYADGRLGESTYEEQLAARNATFFGVGNAYSRALERRGHEAFDIHLNNAPLQARWMAEHGPESRREQAPRWHVTRRRSVVPWVARGPAHGWLVSVLAAQIDALAPDVILNHDITWLPPSQLRSIAGPDVLLIGQHAAPPIPVADYSPYDLIVSSWPPLLDRMRAAGVHAQHLGLGFDPLVLDHVGAVERDIPVSFVGSLSAFHGARVVMLEELARLVPELQVYAPPTRALRPSSPLHCRRRDAVFGLDMFRVLARSRVTINHHGLVEPHANNMRLFEATGVGALLVTDAKPDLHRYFHVNTEVLTYADAEECAATVSRWATSEWRDVADAGQRRTLAEHTWDHRVEQLLELLPDRSRSR